MYVKRHRLSAAAEISDVHAGCNSRLATRNELISAGAGVDLVRMAVSSAHRGAAVLAHAGCLAVDSPSDHRPGMASRTVLRINRSDLVAKHLPTFRQQVSAPVV